MISGTVLPAFLSFLTCWIVSETRRGLQPKRVLRSRAFLIRIHLPFATNVILELRDERQDAHDELAGTRACVD